MFNRSNSDLKNDAKVIVYVWTSEYHLKKPGMHEGAVAIRLKGEHDKYISFTPKSATTTVNFCDSLAENTRVLSREPTQIFKFKSLDQDAILARLAEMENDDTIDITSQNAPSYMWELLVAGKINNLLSDTSEMLGSLEEFGRGKLHKGKSVAYMAKKTVSKVSDLNLFHSNPAANVIATTAGACAKLLMQAAPDEIKENPVKEAINGAVFSIRSIAKSRNSDNILKSLTIAVEQEKKMLATSSSRPRNA